MAKKMVGILGGMGPEASAYFYRLMIDIAHDTYGAVQDTDFPPTVIYNMPLLGFDETGVRDPSVVQQQLIAGVKKLEEFGSDYIVIACNTVHQFFDSMQHAVSVPIIHIVRETVAEAVRRGYKRVFLLTSESTNNTGLYREACSDAGIDSISVDSEGQSVLNQVIVHVMAGAQSWDDVRAVAELIHRKESDAEAIILGCTELPLAIHEGDLDLPVLNSNRIILESVLKKVMV